jgi:hypothetical protein
MNRKLGGPRLAGMANLLAALRCAYTCWSYGRHTVARRLDSTARGMGGMEISDEDLAAFNSLVQDGLIEVVAIDEDGMPYYRIASEFAGPLETTGPGR